MTLKGHHHLSYLRQQHSAPHSENPGCGRRGLYPRTPDKGEGGGKERGGGEGGLRHGCWGMDALSIAGKSAKFPTYVHLLAGSK